MVIIGNSLKMYSLTWEKWLKVTMQHKQCIILLSKANLFLFTLGSITFFFFSGILNIELNHFAVHLKPAQHCKSTILQ